MRNLQQTPVINAEEQFKESMQKPMPFLDIAKMPPPEPLDFAVIQHIDYPVDALGDVLGGMAKLLHRKVKAPLGICGQSVLMTGALIAQGYRNVAIDGRTIPLSLFALSIGKSGERKSGVDKLAFAPIRLWEREQQDEYAKLKKQYRIESDAYKLAEANLKKRLKGEEDIRVIEQAYQALGGPPIPPTIPKIKAVDATVEGLQKHLRTASPNIGVYTDEGAIFFGGHSMTKEKAAKTIGLYSTFWDGSEIDMTRASEDVGAFTLYDRRLSIHLMIQPIISKEVFADPLLMQQGFIPRFLITEPESTIGTRFFEEGNVREDAEFKRYFAHLKSLLDKGFPIDARDGSLDLIDLPLQALAKDLWIKFHDEVEAKLAPMGDYAHVTATGAKLAEQALRIAGVLTVINSQNTAKYISTKEMQAGIDIANYSMNQLLCMVEQALINPVIEDARALLTWIAQNQFEYVYSSLEANKRPRKVRSKDDYDKAVKLLSEHGYIFPVEDMELDGRNRKEVFRVIHYFEPEN
ncbi:YfjI family protein [Thiomicrorhabdus indica]|uniref:YfjI family protein n=1 Tax=Thiomicrorhabdus indica TaxID=2267253 RepID=UPI002AA89073|nr:YfjI family protein [Thiomicrorhabdus indica]